jgi:hypothetical protein
MNIVNARIEKWKYTADDKLRLRLLLPGWLSLEVGSRIMVLELDLSNGGGLHLKPRCRCWTATAAPHRR